MSHKKSLGTTPLMAVDGIFVFIGHHPNTSLFADQITPEETHSGAYRAYKEAGLMK